MKKILFLTMTLLAGGFLLPAAARDRCHYQRQHERVITGYHPCGTPIYSVRVRRGNHYHYVQSNRREEARRAAYERQRRYEIQRAIQRRLEHERLLRLRYHRGYSRCR